jgi:hypothetical protein
VRNGSGVVRLFAAALLAIWCIAAVAADPLVIFLLRMLRDQVISSAIESGVAAAQEKSKQAAMASAAPRTVTPPATEDQWLRGLVDESFVHLSAQQREELHASLMRILNDPKHAATRATIIAEFTRQAIAMRDAHRQLSRLSPQEMHDIAVKARREYEQLPPEQRQQMVQVLQHGIPGMPRALNDVMLAEFGAAVPRR